MTAPLADPIRRRQHLPPRPPPGSVLPSDGSCGTCAEGVASVVVTMLEGDRIGLCSDCNHDRQVYGMAGLRGQGSPLHDGGPIGAAMSNTKRRQPDQGWSR